MKRKSLIDSTAVHHGPAHLRVPSPATFLLPLLLFALSGCSMLTYTSPGGEHFSRCSFGSKTAIASLSVEAGTNGVRRVELQGYQNDANQALSTVTEAAVRAAVGGVGAVGSVGPLNR